MTHQIKAVGAQGELLFVLMKRLPSARDLVAAVASDGKFIVGHSETGHHHVVEQGPGIEMYDTEDPLISYLSVGDNVSGGGADVIHMRPWDTHETLRLPSGTWKILRQREMSPQGWRRVED